MPIVPLVQRDQQRHVDAVAQSSHLHRISFCLLDLSEPAPLVRLSRVIVGILRITTRGSAESPTFSGRPVPRSAPTQPRNSTDSEAHPTSTALCSVQDTRGAREPGTGYSPCTRTTKVGWYTGPAGHISWTRLAKQSRVTPPVLLLASSPVLRRKGNLRPGETTGVGPSAAYRRLASNSITSSSSNSVS